ncbi:MAG: efflux RND transporter periplasmic adaptor subunit [Aquisalimonadaceae bacterium]
MQQRNAMRICLGIGLCLYLAAASTDEPPPRVATAPAVVDAIITEVDISGSVVAPRVAQVSVPTAGLITEVNVEVGERVSSGDMLVRLDDALEMYSLRYAEAEVREAEENLKEAVRLRDEAEAAGARQNIPETQLRAREHQVRAAEAALARLRAAAARQSGVVARHTVTAPFDGVISAREGDLGEWVEPGTTLLELVDVNNLLLEFAVPQDVFHRVRTDTRLTVRLDAHDAPPSDSSIRHIIPVSDPQARTFRIRAILDNPPPLAAGMSARGTLHIGTGEQGVVVPRDALQRYPEGRMTVWVVVERDGHHRVREQRVRLGERFGDRVVVRDGLSGNEVVVVNGKATVEDGQRVEVQ